MIIYPAIDIIDGRCVRLRQGDFAHQTTYNVDPKLLASNYAASGAEWLHVVDLDAAKSTHSSNLNLIADIASSLDIKVQTGGGVRQVIDIQQRLQAGISRVVIGSIAVEQPDKFCDWLSDFGAEHLVAALDVQRQGERWLPAVHGWQKTIDRDLFDLLEQLCEAGLQHLLCTDIGRDGMLQGPNIELYQQLQKRFPNLSIQASGGVDSLDNITALQQHHIAGLIIGKALLDGRFELSEALSLAHLESA